MGRDKAGIALAGETLLERATRTLAGVFPEVLVVGRRDGTDGGRASLGSDAPMRFGGRSLADSTPRQSASAMFPAPMNPRSHFMFFGPFGQPSGGGA